MNETNKFNLDMDSEKSNFDAAIRSPQNESQSPSLQFEPITFSSENYLKPDFGSYSTPQMEMLRPMSGKFVSSIPETAPLIPVIPEVDPAQQNSSQEQIYKQMNNMSLAMQELNSKIAKKQDLTSNDRGVTEARITNDQKNIMFFDRLSRSLGRFSWS